MNVRNGVESRRHEPVFLGSFMNIHNHVEEIRFPVSAVKGLLFCPPTPPENVPSHTSKRTHERQFTHIVIVYATVSYHCYSPIFPCANSLSPLFSRLAPRVSVSSLVPLMESHTFDTSSSTCARCILQCLHEYTCPSSCSTKRRPMQAIPNALTSNTLSPIHTRNSQTPTRLFRILTPLSLPLSLSLSLSLCIYLSIYLKLTLPHTRSRSQLPNIPLTCTHTRALCTYIYVFHSLTHSFILERYLPLDAPSTNPN